MTEKTFKIVGDDISDGYHTFGELYDHRCLLFIALVLEQRNQGSPYWVRDHYDGWDLLVIAPLGMQMSYHVPAKYRHLYEYHLLEKANEEHVYDGHTPADVLVRLQTWIEGPGTV